MDPGIDIDMVREIEQSEEGALGVEEDGGGWVGEGWAGVCGYVPGYDGIYMCV